jgi:hypothetical protein
MHDLDNHLRQLVEKHWQHHSACSQILWHSKEMPDGATLLCHAAPVLQEVYAGAQDGEICWTAFTFDFSGFGNEFGIEIEAIKGQSVCPHCDFDTPFVGVRGRLNGESFDLFLHLAPVPGVPPLETFDTVSGQVRPIEFG